VLSFEKTLREKGDRVVKVRFALQQLSTKANKYLTAFDLSI